MRWRCSACYGATETAAMVAVQSRCFLAGGSSCGTARRCGAAFELPRPRCARRGWPSAVGEKTLQPLVDANGWWRSGDGASLEWAADGKPLLFMAGWMMRFTQAGNSLPDQLAQRLLEKPTLMDVPLLGSCFFPWITLSGGSVWWLWCAAERVFGTDQWHQMSLVWKV